MEENKQAEQEQVASAANNINTGQQKVGETSDTRPSTDEDHNWKETRNIIRELRQRNEELEVRMNQFSKPQDQVEDDPFASMSPDDVMTFADVQKYADRIATQKAQQTYEKLRQQQEIETTPSKYSDYDDIIQYVEPLVKQNPALMGAIQNAPNPREAAYQIAKMYVANQANSSTGNAKKIEENLSKPQTSDNLSNSTGFDPGTRPGARTLEERARIWEQSQKFASMR